MPFASDPDCFACRPFVEPLREDPWQWSEPRALCWDHKRGLTLSDGLLLDEALARVAPVAGPLEGSSLAWIFNPVAVVDARGQLRRGWTDFAAGGMAVYEDCFDAGNWFEFVALHSPPAVDLLYGMHLAAASPDALPPPENGPRLGGPGQEIARVVWGAHGYVTGQRGPGAADSGLMRLRVAWAATLRIRELRTEHGRMWPQSHQELLAWIEACGRSPPDLDAFYPALHALIARRLRI